jgi:hypothetical protein
MGEYDISGGSGKTLDARKKEPAEVVNDVFEITLDNCKSGPDKGGTLDPRKVTAKPSGTSDWKPTMI